MLEPKNSSCCRFDEMLAGLAALLRDLLFHVVTQNGRVTAWVSIKFPEFHDVTCS